VQKIRQLGRRRSRPPLPARTAVSRSGFEDAQRQPRTIALRPFPAVPPRVLVVGSSTGGPQALQVLMRGLAPVLGRLPVLITQHMPPTFTAILAEHIARASNRPAQEAVHGETPKSGHLYIA